MKAPLIRKTLRPTGKWLSDADLRHDAAIVLGCYTPHGGPPVNVNFTTPDLREYQAQIGGGLVVDKQLTYELYLSYLRHIAQFGEKPGEIYHMDYPDSLFIVRVFGSARTMSRNRVIEDVRQANIPGPVKYILFFRVPLSKPVDFKGGIK
jgi:hypothetical protein